MARDPDGKDRVRKTRALYDRLVECFRERPGNCTYAARQAGVSRTMAKTAWTLGWAGISWARPIQARIAEEGDEAMREVARRREEREQALAAQRAADDAEREAARRDRVKTIAEELALAGSMRRGVQKAADTVLALTPALAPLVRTVIKAVADETTGPDGRITYSTKAKPDISAKQAMDVLRHWSTIVSRVALATEVVIELGREMRGPDDLGPGGPELSPEEAKEELNHLFGIWEQMKARDEARAAEEADPDEGEDGAPPGMPLQ